MVRDLDLLSCLVRGPGVREPGPWQMLFVIRFQEIVNSLHFECTNGVRIVSRDEDIYGSGAA